MSAAIKYVGFSSINRKVRFGICGAALSMKGNTVSRKGAKPQRKHANIAAIKLPAFSLRVFALLRAISFAWRLVT
jgi:hypothetical protein